MESPTFHVFFLVDRRVAQTRENPVRTIWVVCALEPRPQFHNETPIGRRKERNFERDGKQKAKLRAVQGSGVLSMFESGQSHQGQFLTGQISV